VTKLKEVTPEQVVIVIQVTTFSKEGKITLPPEERKCPARIEKAEAANMEDPKKGDKIGGAEVLDVKEGEEEIPFGDHKIKCKWRETKSQQEDQTTVTKAWTSDEVPARSSRWCHDRRPVGMTSKTSLTEYNSGTESGKVDRIKKADGAKDKGDERAPAEKKNESGSEKKEQKDKK